MILTRTRTLAAGAALTAVLAVGGGTLAWADDSSSTDDASESTPAASDTLPQPTAKERAKLKADIDEIRQKALDGDYGDAIKQRAEDMTEPRADREALRDQALAALPEELKKDLEAAKDSDDPRAALEEIREKALAGDYGDKAKAWAELAPRRGPGGHGHGGPLGGRLLGELDGLIGPGGAGDDDSDGTPTPTPTPTPTEGSVEQSSV